MPKYSWKEKSRLDWNTELEKAGDLPIEYITAGCPMRIAGATELMAKNYQQMQKDLERYKELYNIKKGALIDMENENRTLRGVVTRFRNERDKLKGELLAFSGNQQSK